MKRFHVSVPMGPSEEVYGVFYSVTECGAVIFYGDSAGAEKLTTFAPGQWRRVDAAR